MSFSYEHGHRSLRRASHSGSEKSADRTVSRAETSPMDDLISRYHIQPEHCGDIAADMETEQSYQTKGKKSGKRRRLSNASL